MPNAEHGQRIYSLDWLRAIAIVIIIAGHCTGKYCQFNPLSTPYILSLALQDFAATGMVIFFVLSGYFLIKEYSTIKSGVTFYLKRFNRIIPLFIVWSYIYYIYDKLNFNLYDFFRAFISGPTFYHLWFVYTIIGIYIFTPFLSNVIYNTKTKYLILLLAFNFLYMSMRPFFTTYHIYMELSGKFINIWLLYYILGYIVQRNKKTFSIFQLLAVFIICASITYFLSLSAKNWLPIYTKFVFYPYDENLIMPIQAAAFFLLIKKINIYNRIVNFLSRRSYSLYLAHPLFLNYYNNTFVIVNPYLDMALSISFTLGCCIILDLLLTAIPFKKLPPLLICLKKGKNGN